MKKEVTRNLKNREEITKVISYGLQFPAAKDLQQAHYQILLIILQKKFIKLNAKIVICAALNTQILKMI